MHDLRDWTRDERHTQWMLALYREYESLNWSRRLGLTPAVLRLHQGAGFWGRWLPHERTIALAARLIEEFPWRVVVEILKHEMAHQLTQERLFAAHEPAHGPAFQRACDALRVEPWARRAHTQLDRDELLRAADWRAVTRDERSEKYLRRLEKLLALAGSANENEALLAMRRARELQTQYRLEGLRAGTAGDFVSLELHQGRRRHLPYAGPLAAILIAHFHVRVVFISRYNAALLCEEAVLDLLGRRADVEMAAYVHAFLHRSVEELWRAYRRSGGAGGLRQRNSYIRGILAGFDEKLARERDLPAGAGADGATRALVAADRAELTAYERQRYPRLSSRGSGARIDMEVYREGQVEGRLLNLRRPLDNGADRSPGRLLLAGPKPST